MNGVCVNVYSLSKEGTKTLSKNFKIREFKCNDGSDTIFVSPELVTVLQDVRDHFGRAVFITSAYRTDAYNKKCGGSAYSQHKYGTAADFTVNGVSPSIVQKYLEDKYPTTYGIGKAETYTHIDVRPDRSRWEY